MQKTPFFSNSLKFAFLQRNNSLIFTTPKRYLTTTTSNDKNQTSSRITSNDFTKLLRSGHSNQLSHETTHKLQKYLEKNQICGQPGTNTAINNILIINNLALNKALEKNLGTNVSIPSWIHNQEEKDSFDRYVQLRKKFKNLASFNLKVFAVSFTLALVYRIYYYFEYDIDLFEPRVSSYHIYRFR